MATSNIKGMTNSLRWLGDLLSYFQQETIRIPANYREQVLATKKLLESDGSGIVNSMLDFAISCAVVDFTVETNNQNLTDILNKWLFQVNKELRGKIPVGIKGLAKEYFRERWKGSSHLVLRTFWGNSGDLELPTTMFFLDGEDVVTTIPKGATKVELGKEQYELRVDNDPKNNIILPKDKNELLYVQKPYESWGVLNPIPYLIRKGLFRNLKFMQLISEKGEYIIGRALEYLMVMKKGTERMALDGRAEMVYSEEDLTKVKNDFATFLSEKKNSTGTPIYATNFDTDIQHLIPEYNKAINETIYAPIERKLMAGLGLVDIVTGVSSNRRESILNPKPFIAEVEQGINDFKSLLNDIIQTIIDKNIASHPKYFSNKNVKIQIYNASISQFIDDALRDHIRSMYDRGTVSIQTYNELVGAGHVIHSVEVSRRKLEAEAELEELMYPHITQNVEDKGFDVPGQPRVTSPIKPSLPPKKKESVPPDKKGIEKKNYKGKESDEEVEAFIEPYVGLEEDLKFVLSLLEMAKIVKRKDGWHVISEKNGKNLGGPYKTYKEAVKRLKQVEWFKHQGTEQEDSINQNSLEPNKD